jgi:hypothetical protein
MPVSAPIVYAKRDSFAHVTLGEIGCEQPAHSAYQALLNETIEQGYARLIAP